MEDLPVCPLTGTTVSRLRETIWGLEIEWQEVSDLWQEINFKLEMWAEGCSVQTAASLKQLWLYLIAVDFYMSALDVQLAVLGNYTFFLQWLEGLFRPADMQLEFIFEDLTEY